MSKELEAWEKIKLGYICGQGAINEFALRENERENFQIIETALKRLEESEIDAETWKEVAEHKEKEFNIIHEECVRLTEIKNKQDKILRIIKEKRIDIATLLDCRNVEEYNRWVDIRSHYSYRPLELTQEEYELLKEALL